jgi:hypothetical protein
MYAVCHNIISQSFMNSDKLKRDVCACKCVCVCLGWGGRALVHAWMDQGWVNACMPKQS